MEIVIKEANNENVYYANQFLLDLVLDEKKYDSNINENFMLDNFYNEILNNNNVRLLIAFNNNNVALGYIYGYIEDLNSAYLKRKARIEALFINPEYRNKQVASKLIDEFEMWTQSKGIDYIEVSVCKSNINALNLYNKNKYETYKYIMYKEN